MEQQVLNKFTSNNLLQVFNLSQTHQNCRITITSFFYKSGTITFSTSHTIYNNITSNRHCTVYSKHKTYLVHQQLLRQDAC